MSDERSTVAGRVGPHRESHEPRLNALDFVAAGATPVAGYLKWSGVQPIGERWGMAYNADLGCCGFSAWQHFNAAIAAYYGEEWRLVRETAWLPLYARLDLAYFAYGIAQGEPGPDPDQGVSNAAMLAWAYKLGLIDGYLEVPLDYADWFAMTFHGAIVGQVLDGNEAISDFNAHPRIPWAAMGKSDGHDTLLIESDGEGNGAEVTWGGIQPFDRSFRENNWTDVWVIIDKEDPNVDFPRLSAILEELHGTVNQGATVSDESVIQKVEDEVHEVIADAEAEVEKIESEVKGLLEGAPEAPAVDSVPPAPEPVQPATDTQNIDLAAHTAFLTKFEGRVRAILGQVLVRASEQDLTAAVETLPKDVLAGTL